MPALVMRVRAPSSAAEEMARARAVRDSLRNPPNAVLDPGIDLRRGRPAPITGTVPAVEAPPIAAPAPPPPPEDPLDIVARRFGITRDELAIAVDLVRSKRLGVEEIKFEVCKQFRIPPVDIASSKRFASVIAPRQLAMALSRSLTRQSLPTIGRRFGGRDHTTVLHAVRKMELVIEAARARLPADATIAEWVAAARAVMMGEIAE